MLLTMNVTAMLARNRISVAVISNDDNARVVISVTVSRLRPLSFFWIGRFLVRTSRGVQLFPGQLEVCGFESFGEAGINLGKLGEIWISKHQIKAVNA